MLGHFKINHRQVSTHSRLKAADQHKIKIYNLKPVSTHSRLKAAVMCCCIFPKMHWFQHTAA